MARLVFLHETPFEYLGVLVLSGYLKEKGHDIEVFVASEEGKHFWDKVREYKPDWVGFSSIASIHHECYRLAKAAKKELDGIGTIFGGPYVSYYPDCIKREEVDVIIRGEGEEALLDFLNAHDEGEDYSSIPNLWTKKNGAVISNPVRPLESNLDKYPVPDRDIYYKYNYLRKTQFKYFMTGRDCPYNCYFCFNQEFRKLYGLKSYPMRRHSADRVMDELHLCKEKYPLQKVCFNDDIFPINKAWLNEFLPRYKKEIGIPYSCNIHTNMVNDDVAQLLGQSGCDHVMLGLEAGNPRVRREILGKKFSNEQFYKAADTLHKYGVRIKTYNMMGCPTETLDEALETMELNSRAKVEYPWCGLFHPLPGTRSEQIAREKGLIKESFTLEDSKGSVFLESHLDQPDIKKIQRAHKVFYFGARNHRLIPLIRKLVQFRLGYVYNIIFLMTYLIRYMRETGNSFFNTFLMGIKNIKNF
ncbi:hypothetical protein CEE37_10385 [candidate division LCP-89 bacterium B3_LCP]|uniref:Uncharacterized protein n=1 Tax=candidate division LCP-89 bacterium B3_LCP TaxID=2012998 RepID=A0A532UYU4_UNCL8|nr:MAG: hypothetical protein CEE37_10385 [candidate division LCP-89 bacterium B3_LCP]